MEKLFRHPTVVIKPMFCITPEPFNAVDMVSPLGSPFLFAHHNMVTAKSQGGIGTPVVSVVKTPWFCMLSNQLSDNTILPFRDGECTNDSVPLQDSQDNDLASGSPSAFPGSLAPKGGFITLYFAFERFSTTFCDTQNHTYCTEEPLSRIPRCRTTESKAVRRHSEYEVFQEFLFSPFWETTAGPDTLECITVLTAPTFESAVLQYPGPGVSALRTSSSHSGFILTANWSGLRGHYQNLNFSLDFYFRSIVLYFNNGLLKYGGF